jgi:hypothetical protein
MRDERQAVNTGFVTRVTVACNFASWFTVLRVIPGDTVESIPLYPTPSLLAQAKQSLKSFSGLCHGINSRQPEITLLKEAHCSESTKQQVPMFVNCLFIPEIHEPRTFSAQARSNV